MDMKSEIYQDKWDESYRRSENFAFYPKEEVIKFLNRFVRKRLGIDRFSDIMDFSNGVKGLDYGCGIGRQTIVMQEFGIDSYGVDISRSAIDMARQLARHLHAGDMEMRFIVTNGTAVPFENSFFDITIAEAVFDSMHFNVARSVIREIDRVTKQLVFMSLISGDNDRHYREYEGDEIVEAAFEQGTVQSYYNWGKIQQLLEGTGFAVAWCCLMTEESVISRHISRRYYLVLKKK